MLNLLSEDCAGFESRSALPRPRMKALPPGTACQERTPQQYRMEWVGGAAVSGASSWGCLCRASAIVCIRKRTKPPSAKDLSHGRRDPRATTACLDLSRKSPAEH